MDINKLLAELTVEEKAALVSGTNFMYTNPVPRLGIPSVRMSDGPHGLRVQKEGSNGITGTEKATCFPTAVTTASSWNPDNAYKMGVAIAEEALHYGINVVLGPGVCIKRNPLCGRNFEYFSEDPLLAGKTGAAEVDGIQSKNVGVSVKHYALNNAENYRFMGDSVCDDRAVREIYLKAFEIIVKQSKPHTIMCAYNKVNGEYCSQNKQLLTDILRNEWGFDGLVMSDWGATHDRVKGIKSGLDLEMPGDTDICRKWIIDSVNDGTLSLAELDKAVGNVLRLAERYQSNPKGTDVDWQAHDRLAAEIAEDSAVLLKNNGALPLSRDEKLFVAGDLFDKMRYQGAGSSMITSAFVCTPKSAFDTNGVAYEFCRGYAENKIDVDERLLAEAVDKSSKYDKAVVFVGLTDYVESEGCDRENMRLPDNQLALVDALTEAGKKVIVVLYGGSPVELPFADKVDAILNMYLPGQGGGRATYNLLFGVKSPCGKLAETWVKDYSDVPFGNEFSHTLHEFYNESVFVGYRYYLTANKQVRYPFGFGLSYTTFVYADLSVAEYDRDYTVTCSVTNCGNRDGAEVVQLYVAAPEGVFKPKRELKGFAKVYLNAGETKRVEITLNKVDLRYYDVRQNAWVTEGGKYEIQVCSDCQTVKLAQSVTVVGDGAECPYSADINEIYSSAELDKVTDDVFERLLGRPLPVAPPQKPITLESRFTDLRTSSLMGKILYKAVIGIAEHDMKKAKKLPEGTERDNKIKGAMFLKRILDSNSLISMSMSAGQAFPYNFAEGFVQLANGHFFKGVKCFCSKIKVPKLPKNEEK